VLAAGRAKQTARIEFLVQRAAADPLDVFSLNSLAIEYMQRARETGDVSDLSRAYDALLRSTEVRTNDNYEGLVLLAAVTTIRHDFAGGLALAERAIPLKPREAYGYGVLGDALLGLGRYGEADAAYQKMIDISADISAFGRRALIAQLRGDIAGAEASWRAVIEQAEDTDDSVPEHAAWAHTQLAALYFSTGKLDDAAKHYAEALAVFPGYVHAVAGEAHIAAARGDYDAAIRGYTAAVNTVPLPEYVAALGDVYAAMGNAEQAQNQYDLIAAIEQLYNASGVNLDLQIGLFNADHDRNIPATLERARAAFAEQPSIQAADTLAWVEYKAGNIDAARAAIEAALRTGTLDSSINFHAGMIYRAAGNRAVAIRYLGIVRQLNPEFSVLHARTAAQTLDQLKGQATSE
jgi:tetratricopeptide (TPR) repeat protein